MLNPQHCIDWAGMAVYTYSPSTWKQGNQFKIFFAYEASLDYMRPSGGWGDRMVAKSKNK